MNVPTIRLSAIEVGLLLIVSGVIGAFIGSDEPAREPPDMTKTCPSGVIVVPTMGGHRVIYEFEDER